MLELIFPTHGQAPVRSRPPYEVTGSPLDRAPPLSGNLSLLKVSSSPRDNVKRKAESFFADLKDQRVGDIVTINIVESASASKNATTKTARNSNIEASWSGLAEKLTGTWAGGEAKVGFANDFDGKGETTRTSYLNAYITAQVVEVFPNGNLAIWGSRQVQVNNENQYIHIQGVIRPEDISANNVVLSTFVADAKIELSGQGVVSDKQRTGWLTRILDYVWPF